MQKIIYTTILLLALLNQMVIAQTAYDYSGDTIHICNKHRALTTDAKANEIVMSVLNKMGITENKFHIYQCDGINNFTYDYDAGGARILIDPLFIDKLKGLNFTAVKLPEISNEDWVTMGILLHEMGHHFLGHVTINDVRKNGSKTLEKEADSWAGFMLNKMGADELQALKFIQLLINDPNSLTHPRKSVRIAAVKEGWQRAELEKRTSNNSNDIDDDGLIYSIDKCPNDHGPAKNEGCPAILFFKEKDGKFSFIDQKENLVINYQYEDAFYFTDGLAKVKTSEKYGFINQSNKMVIAAEYDDVKPFSDGVAPVSINGKWALIDKTGKPITEFIYDNFVDFIKDDLEYIAIFEDGIATVKKDGKFGYINNKGREQTAIKYDEARKFHENYAKVKS